MAKKSTTSAESADVSLDELADEPAKEPQAKTLTLEDRFDQLQEQMLSQMAIIKTLGDENANLRSQVKSLNSNDWPDSSELERQKQRLRDRSRRPRPPEKKYPYEIRIRPKGKRDNNGEPVEYKTVLKFISSQAPQIVNDKLTPKTRAMVLAEYNADKSAGLSIDDVLISLG